MIKAKIISGIAGTILTAGIGYYVISLIGKNAVLEATLESTVVAMADYATSTQNEISDWQESFETISEIYQESRNERNETIRGVSSADINKMAQDNPDDLADLSDRLINGLLNDLEAISQHTAADQSAINPNAGTDGVAVAKQTGSD